MFPVSKSLLKNVVFFYQFEIPCHSKIFFNILKYLGGNSSSGASVESSMIMCDKYNIHMYLYLNQTRYKHLFTWKSLKSGLMLLCMLFDLWEIWDGGFIGGRWTSLQIMNILDPLSWTDIPLLLPQCVHWISIQGSQSFN